MFLLIDWRLGGLFRISCQIGGYRNVYGQRVRLPFIRRAICLVADSNVKRELNES